MKQTLLVIGGAVAGGVLGYFAFFWIARHGFYGLVLPGGLLGLGAGLGKSRSIVLPIVCGVAALGLGLFTDWQFEHFKADPSLGYFLLHVHRLDAVTLVMIAAGTALGFYVPYSRLEPRDRPRAGKEPRPLPPERPA